jgi:hypothetical protein
VPADHISQFWAFVFGISLIAIGLTMLETVTYSYTTLLRPKKRGPMFTHFLSVVFPTTFCAGFRGFGELTKRAWAKGVLGSAGDSPAVCGDPPQTFPPGHVPMPMIEENRGAHAPRVFRATPSSVGLRVGDVFSRIADHCTRGRVRSPFYTLGRLTTAEAAVRMPFQNLCARRRAAELAKSQPQPHHQRHRRGDDRLVWLSATTNSFTSPG